MRNSAGTGKSSINVCLNGNSAINGMFEWKNMVILQGI